jgi:hypothetical protein
MVSEPVPATAGMTGEPSARSHLLLFLAKYRYRPKNAVAATLAWMAEERGAYFEVYYDAVRAGRHYGGGSAGPFGLLADNAEEFALLTGGLMTGARHLEVLVTALRRFRTTVICAGDVAFSNSLAAIAEESETQVHVLDEEDLVGVYDSALSALELPLPKTAVMVDAAPTVRLEGVDAYLWPEIFERRALGLEASVGQGVLRSLRQRGVEELLTCGVASMQQQALGEMGFQVRDLKLVEPEDDYASITARLARRWQDNRGGWLLGDPVLASYWLPAACRERRTVIFSIPQARVLDILEKDIAATTGPAVLGRQYDDSDFFTLSRLGQSFQVIDPGRPPLPVLLFGPRPRWSSRVPDPKCEDPSDEELLACAREGRVLASIVFWTGMIRETENLYALMDLLALTGLKAGIVLTAQSLAYRPSPLDLLTVPRDQGGVFPNVEVLLGSCGTGAAIESLLTAEQLALHLKEAQAELERLAIPPSWLPEGWWATMDVPLVPLPRRHQPRRLRWSGSAPYGIQVRFRPRDEAGPEPAADESAIRPGTLIAERLRRRLRGSRLKGLFSAYRPYEGFGPGPLSAELAATVKRAGFSYMLSKGGFGRPPQVLYRDGDFVALNYTAGQWDGWTPFETINHVADLRRAERSLLGRHEPGWLLGSIDTCLWAFSGELWDAAPGLAAIAKLAAAGGASGKLVNVPPRVVARYARLLAGSDRVRNRE